MEEGARKCGEEWDQDHRLERLFHPFRQKELLMGDMETIWASIYSLKDKG